MSAKSALPVGRLSDEQFNALPALTDPQVGDLVAIYSRGAIRVARVAKVGRTNITAEYTTEGAWDTARKTHEALSRPVNVAGITKRVSEMAAKNFAFYVRELNPETAEYNRYCPPAEQAERLAKYQASVDKGIETYTAELVAQELDRRRGEYDAAVAGGVESFVHMTTKSVKITEAALIERAA